jgi:septal ring factor EnvC (AmiA/AmiB activator)
MKGITMTFKSALSATGNGILDGLSAIHDASIRSQIKELDEQLEALTKQMTDIRAKKTKLEDQLTK